MKKTNPANTKSRPRAPARLIEWTYREGPPHRSWRWYIAVVAVGVGVAGLLFVAYRETTTPALSMLLWICVVSAYSLAPSREYLAQLDGQLLYVWDVKRNRTILERNLAEFATWKIDEIPADRLNPLSRKLRMRPRSGRSLVEISLTGDDHQDEQILERVAAVVPAAPDIALTLLERLDRFAQRWVGWR